MKRFKGLYGNTEIASSLSEAEEIRGIRLNKKTLSLEIGQSERLSVTFDAEANANRTWGDRSDMSQDELHHSDTMQEKLSLVARFGLSICYERPNQKNYFHIVKELAKHYPEITLTEEELLAEARKWELSHGGMSGRAAQQLMNDLCARSTVEKT